MSIIKKLILKEWFTFFLGSTFILLMVLSLGHILNSLLKDAHDFKTIFGNLSLETPSFLVKIFPVSCLIASLFSINKLKNRNELTAIFASGYSRRRFIVGIGSFGLFIGLILFFVNAYLVPFSKRQQLNKSSSQASYTGTIKKSSISINGKNSGRIWFKGQNYFFSYSSFDRKTSTIYNLDLYYIDTNFNVSEEISADYAEYLNDYNWKLTNVSHYTNLETKTFPNLLKKEKEIIKLSESLDDFNSINANISTLDIWKLYDYIKVLDSNGVNASEYYVSFYDKFSSSLTCIVLAILSAVALFNPNRRSSSFGKNVSFVLGFTFLYWFIYSYFISLGEVSRVPPLLATFGVPGIFIIYLTFYFIYHRKLR